MHILLERLRIAAVMLAVFALAGCSAAGGPAKPAQESEPEPGTGRILVLPHHDIAAPMVETALDGFTETRVVILSPHHTAEGPPVITVVDGFDEALSKRLLAAGALNRPDLVAAEWGITELVAYFDDCALAVGAVSRLASDAALEALARAVEALIHEGCLVVISADFSHGLTADLADRRDGETLELIMSGSPAAVRDLGPEHTDSGPLLFVAMRAAAGAQLEPLVSDHKNAADFIEVEAGGEVTTYYVVEWALREEE